MVPQAVGRPRETWERMSSASAIVVTLMRP